MSKDLYEEVSAGGAVDEFLQDQLVIFQALAEGRSAFPRAGGSAEDETVPTQPHADRDTGLGLESGMGELDIRDGHGQERLRKDKTQGPFGEGSTHTTTARWVTAQLLPGITWYNKGLVCEGVGMHMEKKS